MQHSNGAVSSHRLISKVISATFHTAAGRNLTADMVCRISSAMQRLQSVSQSPLLGPSRQPKNCIRQLETDPSCSVICISLCLVMLACVSSPAASTAWDLEEMKAANNI
jgi:hypothetical protein